MVKDNPEYFEQFKSGDMDCGQWKNGLKFQNDLDDEVLKLFYLPEKNSGAVIASRHSNDMTPKIYDKYRFRDL